MKINKYNIIAILALIAVFLISITLGLLCSEDDPVEVAPCSYKGHENDADSYNFVNVYPDTVCTKLDSCGTCHTGGIFETERNGSIITVNKNACDYCHLYALYPDDNLSPVDDTITPESYNDTLNPFGKDYKDAGRSQSALVSIQDMDSDGDGFTNLDEILANRFPGDASSNPDTEETNLLVYTMEELEGMAYHDQFMVSNSHKQEFDDYVYYEGVKVMDLMLAAGVNPSNPEITGITFIAPDGYTKDHSIDQIVDAFSQGLYYPDLGVDGPLGTECGFVQYPPEEYIPDGLASGDTIPGEQWLMVAYRRDGAALEKATEDPTSGKLNGEGPFRSIVPQSEPGIPDRGSTYSPSECGDDYDFDAEKDHNAGSMVRGIVAIRINPMPEGYEGFDVVNEGWSHIENETFVIYGYGITGQ